MTRDTAPPARPVGREQSSEQDETVSPPTGQRPEPVDLDRALEAMLIVADEPVPLLGLATSVSRPVGEVRAALARLTDDYDGRAAGPRRGFELREVGGGWRFYVREDYDDLVEGFVLTRTPSRLSQAALETLAVIAYRQPVTRGQVAQVRAVNVDSVVRTLVARGLVSESGHDPITGAALYITTEQLLVQLGLGSIEELPKVSPLLEDGQDGLHE